MPKNPKLCSYEDREWNLAIITETKEAMTSHGGMALVRHCYTPRDGVANPASAKIYIY